MKTDAITDREDEAPACLKPPPQPSLRRYPVAWPGLPLILFSLLTIGACGGGLSEADQRYNEALDAQNAGRLEEAVDLYTEAIDLDPGLVDAYINRSQAYNDLERFDEAAKDATKAIEIDPNDALAYAARSMAYLSLGRIDEALEDANKAIELDAELALAYASRSGAYRVLEGYDQEAVEDASRAIELDPDLVFAYLSRARAYVGLDQFDKAVEDASKAIELAPDSSAGYSIRGVAYGLLDRYDEALADATKAIELDSDEPEPYFARYLAHLGLGQGAGAEQDLVKACDLGLTEACDALAESTSGEEAQETLQQIVPQLEDLPPGFESFDSSSFSLEEAANVSDDPEHFRRELESWNFVLGYSSLNDREAEDGLLVADFEVWLLGNEEGASKAFVDGALFLVYNGDVTEEEIRDFTPLGEQSQLYRLSGPHRKSSGEEIQAEGYSVTIRVGRFLASFATAWPAGQANQAEAERLAAVLESRMESQAQ